MKTLLKLLLVAVCISLVASCEKEEDIVNTDLKSAGFGSEKTDEVKMVTVPFDARFTGEYVSQMSYGDEGYPCELPYYCHVVVDFVGTGTHLGKFSGNFEFCACGPDDPEIDGKDWQYAPTESYMVAANGDSLFISCWGSVVAGRTEEHPEYVTSYWRDEFAILGGTGRFKNASGGGMTDDYNSNLDPNSHHHWVGTITLMKGNSK